MDIVCFGQQNWDFVWITKQHLLTRLARRGHRVLHVDPDPVRIDGSLRAAREFARDASLREVEPNVHVLTPRYLAPLGWRWNWRRRVRETVAVARRLGMHAPVVVAHRPQRMLELAAPLSPAGLVYFAEDDWTQFGGTTSDDARKLRSDEDALLREVDLALAISPRLVRRMSRIQPRTHLLPNAVDAKFFAPGKLSRLESLPAVADVPRPRLGFVGQVDDRLDVPLLESLAKSRPDWRIVLIGRVKDGCDFSPLERRPNVHFTGFVPYEDLPRALREIDVCLIPYRETELTHSCWPLKAFEYLATGRPVISTRLESLLPFGEVVALADGAEAFRAAIEAALADPQQGRERRLAVAAENDWDHRTDVFEQRLREARELAQTRHRLRSPTFQPTTSHGDRPWRERALFHAINAAGRVFAAGRATRRLLRGRRRDDVERILVARKGYLGDMVVFLPTLAALRARFPRAQIVLGVQPDVGPAATELVRESGSVDEIRPMDHLSNRRATAADTWNGLWRNFREGFDLVLSGDDTFLMREAFFTGAPRRWGVAGPHPLQRYNSHTVPLDPLRHEAETNLSLLDRFAPPATSADRAPRTTFDRRAAADATKRLAEELGLPADAPLVVLHAGSKKPSRRWPAERFGELATRLLADDPRRRVLFTGGNSERALVDAARRAIRGDVARRAHDVTGRTDFHGLLGLLARCEALVCNDTGLVHLARACGTPLVDLMGPENHWRWGPHPDGDAPAIVLRQRVPCSPCQRFDCEALFCTRSLTVDEVHDAVREVIASARCDADAPGAPPRLRHAVTPRTWRSLADDGFELPGVQIAFDDGSRVAVDLASLESLGDAAVEPDRVRNVAGNGRARPSWSVHVSGAATVSAAELLQAAETLQRDPARDEFSLSGGVRLIRIAEGHDGASPSVEAPASPTRSPQPTAASLHGTTSAR